MSLRTSILVVVLLVHSPAFGDAGVDPCLGVAEDLFDSGFWDASITEYQRYLFFNPESPVRGPCYKRISACYEELGDFQSALNATRQSEHFAASDSIRDDRRLDAGKLLAKLDQRGAAEIEFAQVRASSSEASLRRRASLGMAGTQLKSYRWEDARASLSRDDEFSRAPSGEALGSIFAEMEALSPKSPTTARRLSTFLPGAGQVYSGNVLQGLHSFALNFLFGALLVHGIDQGQIGLTAVSALLFAGYYRGGRYHAARLADERNLRELTPLVNRATREIRRVDRDEFPSTRTSLRIPHQP